MRTGFIFPIPARNFIRRGVVGVFGSGPGKQSLLAALFVINSAQDLIRHFHPSGIDQRFVGGAQQLSIKMAERLGERVILGAWVSQINHGPRGVEVVAGDSPYGRSGRSSRSRRRWLAGSTTFTRCRLPVTI